MDRINGTLGFKHLGALQAYNN